MNQIAEFKQQGGCTLSLSSTEDSLAIVENLVDELVAFYHINEEFYANIIICLNEAVTNAIYHGNKQNANKKISLKIEVINHKKLICTIADDGDGFNFNNLPDPTVEKNLENLTGRGVFIMKQLADQCIFNSKGNEVELHFRF